MSRAFREIWKNFRIRMNNTSAKGIFVGEDHIGNKYFEIRADKSKSVRQSRYIEARTSDQTVIPDVPPEWDSWLRGRKDLPPTQEELDRNYVKMLLVQKRAQDLEEKHSEEDMMENPTSNEQQSSIGTTVTPNPKDSGKSGVPFPTYEDFEVQPGDFKYNADPQKGSNLDSKRDDR